MNNIIEYKGYYSKVEYSKEDNVLYGKIEGIKDLVNFECENAADVQSEFQAAVDDYLEFCKMCNKEPDKTYKGSFNVRISPQLHKAAALLAFRESRSLNDIVEQAIDAYVNPIKCFNHSQISITEYINAEENEFNDGYSNYTLKVTTSN